MAVFRYNPSEVPKWGQTIVEIIGSKMKSCSDKFKAQIDALMKPDVWSGDAAAKNLKNFEETHTAMVKFINEFGDAYEQAVQTLSTNVRELEHANLGKETNVTPVSLDHVALQEFSTQIATAEVVYDYETISSIQEALAAIKTELEGAYDELLEQIKKVDNGSGMWDGQAAQEERDEMMRILNDNMKAGGKIFSTLQRCIDNINQAAINAYNADKRR